MSATVERTHALRLAIGPVQGFIAPGRRTRDLWAGSFLLSLLSGTAMKAVIVGDGRIDLPVVMDGDGRIFEETLRAVQIGAEPGKSIDGSPRGPIVGTLVNHFRAEVPETFDAIECKDAIKDRFSSLAAAVFKEFIQPALDLLVRHEDPDLRGAYTAMRERVEDRWRRQTTGEYFEILWVKGPLGTEWAEECRWLGRRKTWRAHLPLADDPREDGAPDRCPVYPEFAELGGFVRARPRERFLQDEFWKAVRYAVAMRMYGLSSERPWPPSGEDRLATFISTLEIREGERLSGFALVKRLFPLLSEEGLIKGIGWIPTLPKFTARDSIGEPNTTITPEECRLSLRNWASTAFVSAIPWIVTVYKQHQPAAQAYSTTQWSNLDLKKIWQSERPQHHKIKDIDELEKEPQDGMQKVPLFAVLDGTLHFPRGLEWRRLVERDYHPDRSEDEIRRRKAIEKAKNKATELQEVFKTLKDSLKGELENAEPSPFYAFLEMDGDHMGRAFSRSHEAALQASKSLLNFGQRARWEIWNRNGFVIYAGADEVLAMLPIEEALPCAAAIRRGWDSTFATAPSSAPGKALDCTLSASILFADYQVPLREVKEEAHRTLGGIAKNANGRDSFYLQVRKSGGKAAEWVTAWNGSAGGNAADAIADFAAAQVREGDIASRLPYMIAQRFAPLLQLGTFLPSDMEKLLEKELSDSGKGGDQESRVLARRVLALIQGVSSIPNAAPRGPGALLVARFLAQNMLKAYLSQRAAARSSGESTP